MRASRIPAGRPVSAGLCPRAGLDAVIGGLNPRAGFFDYRARRPPATFAA
jgi:hypothetical protein